jgi:hypothetical protein
MRIRVYLRDGRTCYRLAKRGQLADLLTREPAEDSRRSQDCERAIYNPLTGELTFTPVRLRHIARASISVIEEDPTHQGEPQTSAVRAPGAQVLDDNQIIDELRDEQLLATVP